VVTGSQRIRAFPPDMLEPEQVPRIHRLALQQVETVAGKAAAMGHNHSFGTPFGNLDSSLDVVR